MSADKINKTMAVINELMAKNPGERIAYLSRLERTEKLKEKLEGTLFILPSGEVAIFTLGFSLNLFEPSC